MLPLRISRKVGFTRWNLGPASAPHPSYQCASQMVQALTPSFFPQVNTAEIEEMWDGNDISFAHKLGGCSNAAAQGFTRCLALKAVGTCL